MTQLQAEVFLDAHGILRVVHPRGIRVAVDEARRIRDAHEKACGGSKVPVLVDARGVASVTLEARRMGAGPEVARLTSRLAILVGGPVSALLGNFFQQVTRPIYPTRMFTEVESAEAWLLDQDGLRGIQQ